MLQYNNAVCSVQYMLQYKNTVCSVQCMVQYKNTVCSVQYMLQYNNAVCIVQYMLQYKNTVCSVQYVVQRKNTVCSVQCIVQPNNISSLHTYGLTWFANLFHISFIAQERFTLVFLKFGCEIRCSALNSRAVVFLLIAAQGWTSFFLCNGNYLFWINRTSR